jgi:signal transduction histidine kinase
LGIGDLPRKAQCLILGVVGAGFSLLAWQLIASGSWDPADFQGFVAVIVMVALAHYFLLEIRHGSEQEGFSLADAPFVIGLMLLRPGPFLLASALGVAAGYTSRRVAPLKVVFNVGQYLVALGLASLIYRATVEVGEVGRPAWPALIAAMGAFLIVNGLSVDLIIAWVEGTKFWPAVLNSVGFKVSHWAANVAIGLVAVILWTTDKLASLLLVVPLVLAHLSYESWLQSRREGEQIQDMIQAAEKVSLETDLSRRMPETDETPVLSSLASTLNRMLERIDAAFHRERRFIRDASHELRTPVTITRGYLEMLGSNPEPTDVQEAVDVAMDELDRMGRLITDLTTLAKADDPGFVVPEDIELGAFMDRIAAKVRSVLDGRLRYDTPSASVIVHADEQRLTQALLNLLNNAVVHTSGNSPIELRAIQLQDAWRFEVVDHGGGLPPGEEEGIFQPFRRLNGDRPGSGLGLAIVRGIAEAHGGRAGVDNRPGEGATFWIDVPRTAPEA